MSDAYHATVFRPAMIDIVDDVVPLEESVCAARWPEPLPDDDLNNKDPWWEFTGLGWY